LRLLQRLPESSERDHQELEFQTTLGGALIATEGLASPQMGHAYMRARQLCGRMPGSPLLIPTLYGLFFFHQNRAELATGLDVAQELLRVAKHRKDAAARLMGHRIIGASLLFHGRFFAAVRHFERVIGEYDPQRHALPMFVPQDVKVSAAGFLAWTQLFLGKPDSALLQSSAALTLARQLDHSYTSAFVLHLSSVFHQLRGERALVQKRAASLMRIADEQHFHHLLGTGTFLRGWAIADADHWAEGVTEMSRGLAAKRATGAEIMVPYYLGLLAAVRVASGEAIEALSLLDDALARLETSGERWFEAELHRLRGEALLRIEATDLGAETCFQRAMSVAKAQDAKLWELRAATSLARLWAHQGRRSGTCSPL
jgi:predicted ATPase